ncbi:MAG: hypothetical protein ABSF81_12115 [Bacteroidales bacterium]
MNDSATYNINNQYMFGPSFLVNPVVEPLYYLPNSIKVEGSIEPDANTNTKLEVKADYYVRSVYLPKGTQWFDFWTGKNYEGGNTIKADARFETMPLFVKAGAIIPMGPFIQQIRWKLGSILALMENLQYTKMKMTITIMRRAYTHLYHLNGLTDKKY